MPSTTAIPTTSPSAKRLKTSHSPSSSTAPEPSTAMATSEPANIPVATTKIDDQPPLLIKKLSPSAQTPTRGSAFAAGYDLYASKATTVPARGKVLVSTDLAMAVPAGTCTFPLLSQSYSHQLTGSPRSTLSPVTSLCLPSSFSFSLSPFSARQNRHARTAMPADHALPKKQTAA